MSLFGAFGLFFEAEMEYRTEMRLEAARQHRLKRMLKALHIQGRSDLVCATTNLECGMPEAGYPHNHISGDLTEHAHRGRERITVQSRPGDTDGRADAPLLAADRRSV
jgi:hypothetical protein